MTSDITLELDHHRVRLLRRGDEGDVELGRVELDDTNLAARLGALRQDLGNDPVAARILLPPALVLLLDVGEVDRAAVETRIQTETPCSIDELAIGRSGAVAAAVERTTLEEARDFARANGFEPASYLARREDGVEIAFRLEPLDAPAFRSQRGAPAEEVKAAGEPAETPPPAAPRRAASPHGGATTPSASDAKPPRTATPTARAANGDRPEPTTGAAADWRPKAGPGRAAAPSLATTPVAPVKSEAEALTVFGARDREVRSRGFTVPHAIAAVLAAGLLLTAFELVKGEPEDVAVLDLADAAAPPEDPAAASIREADADVVDLAAMRSEPDAGPQPAAESAPDPRTESPPAGTDQSATVWDAPTSDLASPPALPRQLALPDLASPPAPMAPRGRQAARSATFVPPPPPGSVFDMDERGRVRPTEDGALTPKGIPVYAGPPAVLPPDRPGDGNEPQAAESADDTASPDPTPPAADLDIARLAPEPRPEALRDAEDATIVVTAAPAQEDTPRPRGRPASVEEVAVASLGPGETPDFDALARQARSQTAGATAGLADTRAAEPPRPEPEGQTNVAVQPSLPTRASVAERATVSNAIRLDRVNLIGVYGSPSDRRALLRLPTGRYIKVKVGDRVDGGRVAAIQSSSVEYVKGGQRYAFTMPNG